MNNVYVNLERIERQQSNWGFLTGFTLLALPPQYVFVKTMGLFFRNALKHFRNIIWLVGALCHQLWKPVCLYEMKPKYDFCLLLLLLRLKKQQLLKQQSRPSITYSDFSMHGECRFFTWFNSFSGELDLTWCCLFIGPIHSYHMDLFVTLMQVKVSSATSKSQVGGVNPFRVKWLWIVTIYTSSLWCVLRAF